MEETKLIFKRASSDHVDKQVIINALKDSIAGLATFPLENLEDDIMSYMMPCMRNLFLEIFEENNRADSIDIQLLLENLTTSIALIDVIESLLDFICQKLECIDLKLLKSMILEIPRCVFHTYKHCKESQKKYQTIIKDSKEILLLYKKNQECHFKFLNIINILVIDNEEEISRKIFIETIESILNIIEVLHGLNVKTLADSWKSHFSLIEKHQQILTIEEFYCIREIELLQLQIKSFMDVALENYDEKQLLQYSKLSGFLLKVALKIIVKFWQNLYLHHLEPIYNLVCSIYNYSPEFLQTEVISLEVKKSIQVCLLDVVTSFVGDHFLNEDVLEQILSGAITTKKDNIGCIQLDLKILEFVCQQQPDSVDSSFFNTLVISVIRNITAIYSEISESKKIAASLMENLSTKISNSVEVHNSFYDADFESLLLSTILGNHIGCHIMASRIWLQIICQTTPSLRRELVSQLLEEINNAQIELSFTSSKVILLKNFMQKLFTILEDNDKDYFLDLYPPLEYLHLWKVIGICAFPENENSVFHFATTCVKDMKNLESALDFMKLVEGIKVLADTSNTNLTNIIQSLWDINFEAIGDDNAFTKYFISQLSRATISYLNLFSSDQIYMILKRMETLATSDFVKIRLCFTLSRLLTRKTKHNMEQNRLNFVISDLFELLLKSSDEKLKEFTLNVFQAYAANNHLIIVNNVSRMLPHMNLEQLLHNPSKTDVFKVVNLESMEHKCLVVSKKPMSSSNSFEWRNNLSRENSSDSWSGDNAPHFEIRNEFSKGNCRQTLGVKRNTSNYNLLQQCKKAKLSEDAEENDTISDVLQRIRSEIKCLNKIVCKEKPTAKNAQDIKLLACQLQSVLEL